MRTSFAVRTVAIALLLALGTLAAWHESHAQTLTFTAETTTGTESVVPKLTWATTPAAASCTASGDTAWTGTKAASGTVTLAAISTSKTYALECSWPGSNSVTLTWTPPTQNTDGTPFTNPKSIKIYHGIVENNLDKVFTANVLSPPTATYTLTGLTPGTWFFALAIVNTNDAESARSNIVSKTLTGAQAVSRSVTITVNPRPNPPTNLAAS